MRTVRQAAPGEWRCTECDCTYPPHCCPDCGVSTVTPIPDDLVTRCAVAAWIDWHAAKMEERLPVQWQHTKPQTRMKWRRIARAVLEAARDERGT